MHDSDKNKPGSGISREHVEALDRRDERIWAHLRTGAYSGLSAGAASALAIFTIQRYSTILKSLTPQAKFATVLSIGLGTSVIAAENAVYRESRPLIARDVAERRAHMTWPEYIFEYRHPIFAGTFAAAVLGGMIAYSRDPYRSGTQKFLNIRLYAQGLGIMALFGTIGLASIISQRHEAKTTLEEKQAAERIQDASKAQDMLLPSKKKN